MEMDMIIFFMCGLWIGAFIGALILAICVTSGRASRWEDEKRSGD